MLLGVDLLTLGELDGLLARPWFREYTYADEELATADALGTSRQREFLAGRFAAKEAIVKPLGRGYAGGVTPRQAAVLRKSSDAPDVRLSGELARTATCLGVADLAVSISHKNGLVVAVAAAPARGTRLPVPPETDSADLGGGRLLHADRRDRVPAAVRLATARRPTG